MTDASQLVVVEGSLLAGVCSLCHSATQQRAGNAGIVNSNICLHPQRRACQHPSRETSDN